MMDPKFITLTKENLSKEHICCGFSDKKCKEGYELKKAWLSKAFDDGHVFRRLDERAKVFIEYGPAEMAWVPVEAPRYLMIHCFWVSGQYKGKGYAKALLQSALEDARQQGKEGLVTVVGTKKFPFMSDTQWLLRQGFETVATLPYGFSLLAKKLNPGAENPRFKASAAEGVSPESNGLVVYYTHRCPFTEYYIQMVLVETAKKRGLPLKMIRLETMEQAQAAPTPATIFSLFYKGKFVTTDISTCLDNRIDKFLP